MIHRFSRHLLAATAAIVIAGAMITEVADAAPAQTASSNLFAIVSKSGALVAGNGVFGVHKFGTGRYEVTFTSDVSHCAYVATTINAYSQALEVFTASGHLSLDGVYVETKNQGGGLTNGPFNLAVDCGQPGWDYAVVGYTANLVRATAGARLTHLGTGRYDVTFPSSVRACAYLATVGDPGNGLVFSPAEVYTASASKADTVAIETKTLAGALSDGVPFHLALVCPTAVSTRIAVIRADGIKARGSASTSSSRRSTGQYTIITNQAVSACATIVTRGSVNASPPSVPATAETTPGVASNTVFVQIRQLLSAGGNFANDAFHAAIVC